MKSVEEGSYKHQLRRINTMPIVQKIGIVIGVFLFCFVENILVPAYTSIKLVSFVPLFLYHAVQH